MNIAFAGLRHIHIFDLYKMVQADANYKILGAFEENDAALVAKENRQLVMHSIEYVKNHFDEELSLSEIVHRSAMSKTSFCTIFNSIFGMPFKEYLNRYRIDRAAELIASGEKISTAASYCGFSDFSTFYRNFKKYMGMSPSQFAGKNKPTA